MTFFAANVDPFDGGGQFIDRGRSYTLAVYYTDGAQKKDAREVVKRIEDESGREVFIAVEPFKSLFEAENHHQHYSWRHPEEFEKELVESGRKEEKK